MLIFWAGKGSDGVRLRPDKVGQSQIGFGQAQIGFGIGFGNAWIRFGQAQKGFGQAQIGFSQAQIEAWNSQKNIVLIDENRLNLQKTLFLSIKIA